MFYLYLYLILIVPMFVFASRDFSRKHTAPSDHGPNVAAATVCAVVWPLTLLWVALQWAYWLCLPRSVRRYRRPR